jgi:hypothetical protein
MGAVEVAPYWGLSVNLWLYFHKLSVGVLLSSVWGICTWCCSVNTGIRKERCPSVTYIGVITFTCAQWHRAVFWTHRAPSWNLSAASRSTSLKCCSFSCWRKYRHKTNGQWKKTNSNTEITEVTIRTNEYAIKVETRHLTVDMCNSTVLRTVKHLLRWWHATRGAIASS